MDKKSFTLRGNFFQKSLDKIKKEQKLSSTLFCLKYKLDRVIFLLKTQKLCLQCRLDPQNLMVYVVVEVT